MRWLALISSSCLLACGHPKTERPTPNNKPGAEEGKLPAGAPLVTPGERMSYKLSLQGVELAVFSLSVGDVQDLDGKQVIVVQSHAKSVGFADWVARIDDKFTSWIDVETGRSRRFQADEYETNSKTNVEHAIADMAGRQADMLPMTFSLNDAAPTPEPQKLSKPEVWDFNTFLVALRAWEQAPGTRVNLEVFRSRYLWNVDARIHGREKVKTDLPDLGEVPALRFDAQMYKLTRDGARYPDSEERKMSIWISDEAGRVPLRIVARTDYGDIKMEIVDYQPGSGQRLRP